MKHYVFAYGSLMCPESCARTLNRMVNYIPATLSGFERTFNAMGQVHSEKLNNTVNVKFANLQKSSQSCHGLVFEIDEEELQKLMARESFYDLVDVSDNVFPHTGKVYTFVCNQTENIEGFILKKYLGIMFDAVQEFPELKDQIKEEIKLLNHKEILDGGFISITGQYHADPKDFLKHLK